MPRWPWPFWFWARVSAQAREKKPKHKKNTDLSANPLANVNSKQPDKELYDKAMIAMKKGRFDVARLDLQTLLNTYPDSEYRMRAKLAVGDSWFKEGGTAALTQAEAEYNDFITFFPDAPEAAEAKMKVGDIYYQQMEKPDRDYTNAQDAETGLPGHDQHVPGLVADSARQAEAARCAGGSGRARNPDRPLLREPRELSTPPLPACRPWSIPTRSTPRATRRCWPSAMPMPARPTPCSIAPGLPGAITERLASIYQDRAAAAYAKVITRYPMAPHVEDARDRLVAMNRPVPEPTQAAIAESDAEERSRQALHFTDKTLGIIKHGPTVVEAVHVGEPTLDDPKRTLAPDVTKENMAIFIAAVNAGKPQLRRPPLRRPGPMSRRAAISPPTRPSDGGARRRNRCGCRDRERPLPADPNAVVKPVAPPTRLCLPRKSRPKRPYR